MFPKKIIDWIIDEIQEKPMTTVKVMEYLSKIHKVQIYLYGDIHRLLNYLSKRGKIKKQKQGIYVKWVK